MLRIGIDARPLQGETKHRGIGKTLEKLIIAIRQIDTKNKYLYYIDSVESVPPVLQNLQPNESVRIVASQKIRRARYFRSILKSFKPIKPSNNDIDVLLQPDASLGVPISVPTVVIFYDLIPLLFRKQEQERAMKSQSKYKSIIANEVYWIKYKKDLRQYSKANHILSISEASRKDLLKYLPHIEESRVSVLHLGVMQRAMDTKNEPTAVSRLKPYLLYVGGIDYRKNIIGLLADFFTVKATIPKLKLVLIGKEFELRDQLADMGWYRKVSQHKQWQKDIIMPGYVSEDELKAYYKNAAAFIFPSIYEGFGLPVLEAMAMGTPVIAYHNSSIPEVAGDAALLAKDGESLAPHMLQLLNDDAASDSLVAKGYSRVDMFSWHKSAKTLLHCIKDVCHES